MAIFLSSTKQARRVVPLRLLAWMFQSFGAARSRRALSLLDDRLLRDIGVSRAEAATEASRPLLDAPPHWRG